MDLVNLAPRARHFIFLLLDWVEANDAFSALGFHLLDEDKKAFARSHLGKSTADRRDGSRGGCRSIGVLNPGA
jgi:hypothetical protein